MRSTWSLPQAFPAVAVAMFLHGTLVETSAQEEVILRGKMVDAASGECIPARLYVISEQGEVYHAVSKGGVAIPYERIRGESRETHTSLSAHPFEASLPPGRYRLIAEKGKEFLPAEQAVDLLGAGGEVVLELRRWIDMNERGWFSGETHVHRRVRELPTLMQCEDLNVTFPLTAWVARVEDTPLRDNKNPEIVPATSLIEVGENQVIWPINTEYEINSVEGERHPIGALFVLNHRKQFDLSAPPIGRMVEEARSQGAFFDLDKHNWPWSMMLVPIAKVDLFELTNNHIWRTNFHFSQFFAEYVPDFMGIELDAEGGFTERGWLDFGLKNYYALLNCGFEIMPTAGTASGVHPVPLGFGRVYVKVEGEFSYEKWTEGLRAGRSFVTTGPILEVTMDGQDPGTRTKIEAGAEIPFQRFRGTVLSPEPIESIELIRNGMVESTMQVNGVPEGEIYSQEFEFAIAGSDSSWYAVRAFARSGEGRVRFAHSAPLFIDIVGKPLKPKRREVEYLLERVEDELQRHRGVLSEEAVGEFEEAAKIYRGLLSEAE